MIPSVIELTGATPSATIMPARVARVASLINRRSGRELLLRRCPATERDDDYVASYAGG